LKLKLAEDKIMAINAALAYQNNAIQTASPAELTLMLYEGAIKFTNIALMAIEEGNVEKVHLNIVKVENIILELRSTLDHKYPVAEDFDRVYDYIYRCLVDANVKKDKWKLEEALGFIREMRDTWKEVMKTTKKK
jgi:flagellar secretion chaperone FliS